MKTVIVVPDVPPSMNAYKKKNWRTYVALKNGWALRTASACCGKQRVQGPVVLTYTFHFGTRLHRDFDNYAATTKWFTDALKGRVIDEDDSTVVTELRIRFGHDPKNPRVEITIESVEPPQETGGPV